MASYLANKKANGYPLKANGSALNYAFDAVILPSVPASFLTNSIVVKKSFGTNFNDKFRK